MVSNRKMPASAGSALFEIKAGAVTLVAVATPSTGVMRVGVLSTTNLVPVPVCDAIDVALPTEVIGPVRLALVVTVDEAIAVLHENPVPDVQSKALPLVLHDGTVWPDGVVPVSAPRSWFAESAVRREFDSDPLLILLAFVVSVVADAAKETPFVFVQVSAPVPTLIEQSPPMESAPHWPLLL